MGIRYWLLALCLLLPLQVYAEHLASAYLRAADESAETSGKVIRYCVDPDWLPYEAIRDGKHVGISSDYIQYIQAHTPLKFHLVITHSWSETLSFLKDGRCDLTPLLNKTASREQYLHFSQVYFRSPNVLVSLREQPFLQGFDNIGGRTLAVPKGYRLAEYIHHYYPQVRTITVDNEPEGLEAVLAKRADLFVGSMFSVNAYIQQTGFNHLKIAGWGGPEDELRIGVSLGNEALLPIINQAIEAISELERISIYRKWNNVTIIDETNYRLIYQIIAATLFILLLLGSRTYLIIQYNRRLTNKNLQLERLHQQLEEKNTELEFLSTHDPLTKLYNRHYFNRHFMDDHRASEQVDPAICLVMVDIDYFKEINDTNGHTIGDKILIELSTVLQHCVRDCDVVARWGGEEFVILCHQSSIPLTQSLCQRIAGTIREHKFSDGVRLTCSFGIAKLMENEPMQSCFERADRALYRAKVQGRDQVCVDEVA
ncbi:diguanylate cyclase [Shewanella sp. CG12_big_fil_rev_8_21_14_0_65_47_15]|uniref:diguanylate cyclase n=1 Tax=Shewanella sp. CG12_big_fil_rev_8_21_14_0_65_47_15 TaxID=1975537 RepID=UPI000CC2A37B|nr:diguanylate cyclase [Shewanella sp. CG12_big_fil_rev_8_21_14_0_65_47_15]PIW59686.1 MAG: diguanylate cyclase [Shewanella sp. CG12_big_fil_rev_8_21_14_0_65_47_15]